MHTIRKHEGAWFVQFVENGGTEPGYRPHRADIVKCPTGHVAGLYASWLNGGKYPGSWEGVEYLGR